jgi:hypothetical protein
MDIARCAEDGQIYLAVTFAALPPFDLERMRQQLSCPECRGPAFFRKASRSGRAACFGARPHRLGCSLATEDTERVIEGESTDLDVLNNPAERIVVDLGFGGHSQEVHGNPNDAHGRSGRTQRYIGGNHRPDARMHRRLSSLLRTLVEAPNFSESQQLLEISGNPEIRVCDFFIPMLDANPSLQWKVRGWWGLISYAQNGTNNSLWLNSGDKGTFSICLPSEMRALVLDRFHLEDNEQLAGAYVLAVAALRISINGKMYAPSNHQTISRYV